MSDEIIAEGTEVKKRRGGRKPMTPEEKEAARKLRSEEKERAERLQPSYVLQYQNAEINLADLAEAAKAAFRAERKRTLVTDLKLYIKPEEGAAYYVINDGMYSGRLDL